MFVKVTRINSNNQERELLVNTDEIAFLSQAADHICYDKPTKFETTTDDETGETSEIPVEWETEPRYVIGFKNGRHPQFIDKFNYEFLSKILTSSK